MFLHAEEGRLEAVHGVALGAISLSRAFVELAFVRVRRVAILAVREGHLFFEVIVEMASGT